MGFVKPKGVMTLSNYGDVMMRIIGKVELRKMVLYSPQHIARLEKAGKFPKRVKLGPNRVGWLLSEVEDWLQSRLDCRV